MGWVSRGSLNHISRRLEVPPAELWGVVSFYHLLSTRPRPPVVAHVCDDIACRIRGGEACAKRWSTRWARPAPPATAATRAGCAVPAWASASGRRPCSSRSPARRRETITLAPVEGGVEEIVAMLADPPATADTRRGRRDAGVALGAPGRSARPAPARPHRARGSHEPRRLPRQRRLPGAGARHHARTGRRHRRGGRLQAGRARRRGVSHRAQVGRGGEGRRPSRTTWSAMRTSPSPGPSRTVC